MPKGEKKKKTLKCPAQNIPLRKISLAFLFQRLHCSAGVDSLGWHFIPRGRIDEEPGGW